jgi:hypothetical protein
LEENLGGLIVELTEDDLVGIERALAEIAIEGERYSEAAMKFIDKS